MLPRNLLLCGYAAAGLLFAGLPCQAQQSSVLEHYHADTTGAQFTRRGTKATVVVFTSSSCPVSKAYATRLEVLSRLHRSYYPVRVVVLDYCVDGPASGPKSWVTKDDFGIVHLSLAAVRGTGDGRLAARLKPTRTPEVFVLNGKGAVVYQGAVDDSPNPNAVRRRYVADALDALLAGKPVRVKKTQAVGCAIPAGVLDFADAGTAR